MTNAYWWGVASVFLAAAAVAVVGFLVLLVHGIFFQHHETSSQCGFCNEEWQDTTIFRGWLNDIAYRRHANTEHPVQYANWKNDYAIGGPVFAQEESWRRRREAREKEAA